MTREPNPTPATPSPAPAVWSARVIRNQLHEALTLLARDDLQNLAAVTEVVDDTLDRLRSLELAQAQAAPPNCTVLSGRRAEPLTEWLLVPFGAVEVERPVAGRSFAFTTAHAQQAADWFAKLGRQLAIDYEHQSIAALNGRSDGLRPAAGWIGGLEVRDDGLWAVDVVWTERARELLAGSEYRYFSPVIYWDDEDFSTLAALGPVALTNDPAMHHVTPLAAGRDSIEAQATVAAAGADLERAGLTIAHLRQELREQEADAFVERGLRLGKITVATRLGWREDFLRDARVAELRLTRAPVVLPPGRSVAPGVPPTDLNATDESTEANDAAADLAAYARALAAGRVQHVAG